MYGQGGSGKSTTTQSTVAGRRRFHLGEVHMTKLAVMVAFASLVLLG